jgi:probable phosphoglycerate mutase
MPARLLLVRHGESTWNATGRWQGWADPPLSPLGEQQASEAGTRLRELGITGVASSDLARARRTAEIVAARLELDLALTDPALREYDVGDWCGLTRPEIEAGWPGLLNAWHQGELAAAPGGEARADFTERAVAAITRLAADERLGDRPVVVTHGGLVRAVERRLGLASSTVANLAGRWIDRSEHGRLRGGDAVVLLGDEERTMSPSA